MADESERLPGSESPQLDSSRRPETAATTASSIAPGGQPARTLQLLWERDARASDDLRGQAMPAELERRYGGELLIPLRPDRPTVVANFVSTLDGIVALGSGDLSGGGLISGSHEPDRLVMALLRAIADVVVVGAGTLRGSKRHRWIAGDVHRASAAPTTAWRSANGLGPNPTTVFVTGSGDVPVAHPALTDPAIPVVIATTAGGARRLAESGVAPNVEVVALGTGRTVDAGDLVAFLAARGARLILTEGGPHLLADLIAADRLDELFLTLSPQLVGRAGEGRLGLVEGASFGPAEGRWQDLVSVRRSSEHLFLRYRKRSAGDRQQES